MLDVAFRPRAEADLDGIVAYLAFELKAVKSARNLTEKIFRAIDQAAELPNLGKAVNDPVLERPYRMLLVGTYWILYSYDEKTLTVHRIVSTLRDLDWLGFEDYL